MLRQTKIKIRVKKMKKKVNLRLLIKLTIPIFLELVLQILLGNVDKVMVRNDYSATAINQANSILEMITVSISVLAAGSLILISQYKGANDTQSEKKVYAISFYFNLFLGIFLGGVLVIFAKPIFQAMNVSAAYFNETIIYLRINGGFLFLQAIILSLSSYLRSNEYVLQSLISSVIFNIINVGLNALFLYGLKITGAKGVAIASVISRFIGCIMLFILVKRLMKLSLPFHDAFHTSFMELKKLLKLSLPAAGESLSYSISQIVILALINLVGLKLNAAAPTSKTYTSIMIQFTYIFTSSISQGMQILLGRYLGASKKEEADLLVKCTVIISLIVSISLAILQAIFASYIFKLFTKDENVIMLCKQIMLIEIALEVGRAINIVLVRALQTSGDVFFPTLLAVIFCWSVAVGGSYLLGIVVKLGIAGVWISMSLDEIFRAIIFCFRWKKGVWRQKRLVYSSSL